MKKIYIAPALLFERIDNAELLLVNSRGGVTFVPGADDTGANMDNDLSFDNGTNGGGSGDNGSSDNDDWEFAG